MSEETKREKHARHVALAADMGRRLSALAERGGYDELRILDRVLTRAADLGLDSYGPIVLHRDKRDFVAELGDEIFDALFYVGAHVVRDRDRQLSGEASSASDVSSIDYRFDDSETES